MVSEAIEQLASQALGCENTGPLEGQIVGDDDGAPFVALTEDFVQQLGAGGAEIGKLVDLAVSFTLAPIRTTSHPTLRRLSTILLRAVEKAGMIPQTMPITADNTVPYTISRGSIGMVLMLNAGRPNFSTR